MIAAIGLGFDDKRAAPGGDFRPEACSGDPAADDNYIKISHFFRWLRIGKPLRLGV
jgi:hypothetical protein